jgi:hypothetical protein
VTRSNAETRSLTVASSTAPAGTITKSNFSLNLLGGEGVGDGPGQSVQRDWEAPVSPEPTRGRGTHARAGVGGEGPTAAGPHLGLDSFHTVLDTWGGGGRWGQSCDARARLHAGDGADLVPGATAPRSHPKGPAPPKTAAHLLVVQPAAAPAAALLGAQRAPARAGQRGRARFGAGAVKSKLHKGAGGWGGEGAGAFRRRHAGGVSRAGPSEASGSAVSGLKSALPHHWWRTRARRSSRPAP